MNRDRIEFYVVDEMVARVESSMLPRVGDKINIRKKTWTVDTVSFSLDNVDDWSFISMRCNVQLVKGRD